MKYSKPFLLQEKFIDVHDIFLKVDPFVAQSLVNVLKFLKFKIDPCYREILDIFPMYPFFGYRTQSRIITTNAEGKVEGFAAYHEGFHNLVSLRFGADLHRRPMMTLLNESLGVPIQLYFFAKLIQATNLRTVKEMDLFKQYEDGAKLMGKSLKKALEEAKKNPFEVYRATALECYHLHKSVFESLRKYNGHPDQWLQDFRKKVKEADNYFFYSAADLALPAIFVAFNCGLKSSRDDLECEKTCLNILKDSKSMSDFLINLGMEGIPASGYKKSA